MTKESEPLPWYKEGLRFQCTQCGQCCTGGPGYVWLKEEDIPEMIQLLGISREEFLRLYTRSVFGRIALIENAYSYDCIFLEGKRCKIYQARPRQCRTFPWWHQYLSSPETWKEAARRCEGIDHPDAPIVPFEKIDEQLRS